MLRCKLAFSGVCSLCVCVCVLLSLIHMHMIRHECGCEDISYSQPCRTLTISRARSLLFSFCNLQAGYYCSVCDCILRDSQSYLDHINGKWHNRALGMSMRVERSNADQVSFSAAEIGLPDGLHAALKTSQYNCQT